MHIADARYNEFSLQIRLYILFAVLASISLSLFITNSICIILLSGLWLLEGGFMLKWRRLKTDGVFYAYFIYFLVQLIGLFHAPDIVTGYKYVETKLAFLALPVIFGSSTFFNRAMRTKLMTGFTIMLTLASFYCMVVQAIEYMHTHDASLFFYHRLVSPINSHAVYFSVFLFIAIVFLLKDPDVPYYIKKRNWLQALWLIYLIGFIILLSSKMVLSVLLLYLSYITVSYLIKYRKIKQGLFFALLISIAIASIFLFNNPVKNRFKEVKADISFLKKERYSPNDYFNGLEFRLLLWRFTYEILRDNREEVAGVGSANAQLMLTKKITDMNLYTGDKKTADIGYGAYNCHNQFLQEYLQSGIIGLFAFIFWCYMLIRKAVQKKNPVLYGILLVLLFFFFTESVFERQYGVILCTIFPLFYLYVPQKHTQ